jgi:hypothetical protein
LAQEVRRHDRTHAKRLQELATENGQLKKLLDESMLEIDSTREALRKKK